MDRQSKIALQELLEHKGWEILKGILVPSLRDQLNASLLSAGRRGDGIEAAKFSVDNPPKSKEDWQKLATDDPKTWMDLTQQNMDRTFREKRELQEKLDRE